MNLQQLREDFLTLISETGDNTHFSVERMNRFANRAVEMTAVLTESAKDFIEIQAQEDKAGYTLPSDNILITSAYFGDKAIQNDLKPIDVYSEETLKTVNPFWLDETTQTQGQPVRVCQIDRVTVVLDPRPNAANSATGKKLVLYYVFKPEQLVNDTDQPNIYLAYHPLLTFYMAYLGYLSLGNKDMSTKMYNEWITHYNLLKETVNKGAKELMRFKWNVTED